MPPKLVFEENLLQHMYNETGGINRQDTYVHYCHICDYGTSSLKRYQGHLNSKNHVKKTGA